MGLVVVLDEDQIGCVLLGKQEGILAGSSVRGTGQVLDVPVGDELLGRVVDPLGLPLDGGPKIEARHHLPIERPAPGITQRQPVTEPLHTGITAIDAMPARTGQRELIIGDRFTGKTAIAVDAILSQNSTDVICIYAAIGQRASSVSQAVAAIRERGPKSRTICVVAASDAAAGLQWMAPYAACAMAEYFSERGGHVLLVLDDLTKHAQIHRQVALLLRQPPGTRGLSRRCLLFAFATARTGGEDVDGAWGGSLTTLPIAETLAGNLSSYIPTNLISITDGQIFLEPRLFNEGQKPAIDRQERVSVGGKTQLAVMRKVSEKLRLGYAVSGTGGFTRFGGAMDERTQKVIERGRRVRAALLSRSFSLFQRRIRLRFAGQSTTDCLMGCRPCGWAVSRRAGDAFGRRTQALAVRIEQGSVLSGARTKTAGRGAAGGAFAGQCQRGQ